jgi:hypothetical protein
LAGTALSGSALTGTAGSAAHQFLRSENAVTVRIQCEQCGAGIGDFVCVDNPVAVGVESDKDGWNGANRTIGVFRTFGTLGTLRTVGTIGCVLSEEREGHDAAEGHEDHGFDCSIHILLFGRVTLRFSVRLPHGGLYFQPHPQRHVLLTNE